MFSHADSASWAPLLFVLVLQGGGGCCNHRFSLSAAFHLVVLPLPQDG